MVLTQELDQIYITLSSQHTQVIGDVDKIVSTVTTKIGAADTTTHNLQNGDIVKMNVVPNLSVGIGTTTPVSVRYNSEFDKLIINPITFAAADVETNRLDIVNHGFATGDKVLYDGAATGLSTGLYYVYKVSDRRIELGETLKDVTQSPIQTVAIHSKYWWSKSINCTNKSKNHKLLKINN